MQTIKLMSPAKLNLRLEVLGKRPDSYHEILTLMERITLFDEVEIRLIEKGIVVSTDHPLLQEAESNIAYRAVKEMMAYCSRQLGVEVKIKKNIPLGAGMGGGSSNAASVIMGLNELFKLNLPQEKLLKIASKLGSDVPFFILNSPAVGRGRGDELQTVTKIPKLHFVLIHPGLSLSTALIYKNLNLSASAKLNFPMLQTVIPLEFKSKKEILKLLKNDLEAPAFKEQPLLIQIKELLVKEGALASMMTGSGSTVFGVFNDAQSAHEAVIKILAKADPKWKVFEVESLQ